MNLTMECDGYRFAITEELTWLLAHCGSSSITVRAPDLVTLRRRISEAVADRTRGTDARHVLHAGGTR